MGKLVAYGGFSTSNYLMQPYNSDLDFGTGDFCIMGWVKDSTYNDYARVIERQDNGSSGNGTFANYFVSATNSGKLELIVGSGGTSIIKVTSSTVPTNTWVHFVGLRKSGVLYLYINGNLEGTPITCTTDVTNTEAVLYVGQGKYNGSFTSGVVDGAALLRISATAPSPEQIAKIYRDEAPLFQDGAQATLYGSSDAVTALAYDDSTELLHVGTSAGRSVFQGLRRVDNTTTAVGAAISASNGLVADE